MLCSTNISHLKGTSHNTEKKTSFKLQWDVTSDISCAHIVTIPF